MSTRHRVVIAGAIAVVVAAVWISDYFLYWIPSLDWFWAASALSIAAIPWVLFRKASNIPVRALRLLSALACLFTLMFLLSEQLTYRPLYLSTDDAFNISIYTSSTVGLVWALVSLRGKDSHAADVGRWASLFFALALITSALRDVIQETPLSIATLLAVIALTGAYGFSMGARWASGREKAPEPDAPPVTDGAQDCPTGTSSRLTRTLG